MVLTKVKTDSEDAINGTCIRSFQVAVIWVNMSLIEFTISLNGLMIDYLRVLKISSVFFFIFGVTDFNASESMSNDNGT